MWICVAGLVVAWHLLVEVWEALVILEHGLRVLLRVHIIEVRVSGDLGKLLLVRLLGLLRVVSHVVPRHEYYLEGILGVLELVAVSVLLTELSQTSHVDAVRRLLEFLRKCFEDEAFGRPHVV